MKSYVVNLCFCYNLKAFRCSTQVINHIPTHAAPWCKAGTQPRIHTSTEAYVHTQRHKHTYGYSKSIFSHPLSLEQISLIYACRNADAHVWRKIVNQRSQMGLNKSRDKASSFCSELQREASEPDVIADAWRRLITFYPSVKKTEFRADGLNNRKILKGVESKTWQAMWRP